MWQVGVTEAGVARTDGRHKMHGQRVMVAGQILSKRIIMAEVAQLTRVGQHAAQFDHETYSRQTDFFEAGKDVGEFRVYTVCGDGQMNSDALRDCL